MVACMSQLTRDSLGYLVKQIYQSIQRCEREGGYIQTNRQTNKEYNTVRELMVPEHHNITSTVQLRTLRD